MDGAGIWIQGDKSVRDKEVLEGRSDQSPRVKEVQHFQQFKIIDLCVGEIRKTMEDFFAYEEVPRRVEEAMAVCERELEEKISSIRSAIGVSSSGRSPEVG